jgi:hypothetical protein
MEDDLSRISQGSLKSLSILVIMSDSEAVPGMGVLFQATNWEACYARSLPMIQAGGCLGLR